VERNYRGQIKVASQYYSEASEDKESHLAKVKHIHTKSILSSERMLHKDYDRKGSVDKKSLIVKSQGAWHQDELIGGKLTVLK
jgi:hypothetical protein